ncbi:Essential protein Yae1, N terminal [Recurvomyces mirabilis]|nr:Essential protein Yae1, N terminal [Recurvomyces mirabilis]
MITRHRDFPPQRFYPSTSSLPLSSIHFDKRKNILTEDLPGPNFGILFEKYGFSALGKMLRDLPLLSRGGDGYHGNEEVFMNGVPGLTPIRNNDDDNDFLAHEEGGGNGNGRNHEWVRDDVPYQDPWDDVFGSAPASPDFHARDQDHGMDFGFGHDHDHDHYHDPNDPAPPRSDPAHPSDLPRLRRTHVTNGYREGMAIGKEREMQEGFDEGYWLGAEMGQKVGNILGVLEGCLAALDSGSGSGPRRRGATFTASGVHDGVRDARMGIGSGGGDGEGTDQQQQRRRKLRGEVRALLDTAKQDLDLKALCAPPWFGEDGVWSYDVPTTTTSTSTSTSNLAAASTPAPTASGHEGSHEVHSDVVNQEIARQDVTFEQVAAAHPVLVKWKGEVKGLAGRLGLEIGGAAKAGEGVM